jgi:2,3-bisphosphoglycerate-dependent phosphoglycerate mutase
VLDLVLLRHGQSTWNAENLFTGWTDVDLSPKGEGEAVAAGHLMADIPDLDLRSVHTSLLCRAIRTANIALHAATRVWIPATRHWRLNERHYGDLQGRDKKEVVEKYGPDQLAAWRRGYDTPPPPLPDGDPRSAAGDPRYRDIPASTIPATECLADVVQRLIPYWESNIVPDLHHHSGSAGAVLVVAHGNSLRALRKLIEGIADEDIVELEVPTGIPFRYHLNEDLTVKEAEYLGDPEVARAAAAEVAHQAG